MFRSGSVVILISISFFAIFWIHLFATKSECIKGMQKYLIYFYVGIQSVLVDFQIIYIYIQYRIFSGTSDTFIIQYIYIFLLPLPVTRSPSLSQKRFIFYFISMGFVAMSYYLKSVSVCISLHCINSVLLYNCNLLWNHYYIYVYIL